jgi:hypothetical protein
MNIGLCRADSIVECTDGISRFKHELVTSSRSTGKCHRKSSPSDLRNRISSLSKANEGKSRDGADKEVRKCGKTAGQSRVHRIASKPQ